MMKREHKHTLLVVDDEPDLVQSVQDLLRRDYRVLGATRAMEALNIMQREQVHIVMSDQSMPEMTGVEFLSRLREKHPDTVRLLFTAYADINAVIAAINQGHVYRYITKPWEQNDLEAILKQAAERYDLLIERKRLLAELQEKNEQLARANEELRHANELKTAFIKVASHELRTPLTIVMGLSELARSAAEATSPLKDWLDRIHIGSARLNERIDAMNKLLLANNFNRPLDLQATSLAQLIENAAREVQDFVNRRMQTLVVEIAPDVGIAEIDAEKIRDCVEQLLMNAVKFTPDGGTIFLSAHRSNVGTIAIDVRDTGMGIDAASLQHIFDPFFTRFDVSRHRSGVFEFDRRGLGLGLSVVKAFVEMHGGTVSVESKVNEGSEFSIHLPAAANRQQTSSQSDVNPKRTQSNGLRSHEG